MEIAGELFVDVPTYRRMAKLELARAGNASVLATASIVLTVSMTLYDTGVLGAVVSLAGILLILLVPGAPVRRLTRLYRRSGPIVWRYRIDEHGFRVAGRGSIEGSWARYTKVVETSDMWLVRPPFRGHRVALPKAAFSASDRVAVAAILHGRRPVTVPA